MVYRRFPNSDQREKPLRSSATVELASAPPNRPNLAPLLGAKSPTVGASHFYSALQATLCHRRRATLEPLQWAAS